MEQKSLEIEPLHEGMHVGTLKIADIGISCAVLKDGIRVLSQGSFLTALRRSATPPGGTGASVVEETPFFISARNLQPFVARELRASSKPILFRYPDTGVKAFGYRAELLPEVCEVYLKAREAGVLKGAQLAIAARCEVLVRAFAKLGIVALVDEATGYQYSRPRQALEQLLEDWIAKDLRKWQKTFPDEFYKQLYRLKGWQYDDVVPRNRPAVIGHITNDIVYSRLAPYVLDALREITPRNDKGRPKAKYHQSLTQEQGRLRLHEHLDSVVTLMMVSRNWNQFMRFIDQAKPVQNGLQQVLDPDDVEDGEALSNANFTRGEFQTALEKVVGKN